MATQSVKVPIQLELENLKGIISQLKTGLNSASKETGFYKNVSKDIDKIEQSFSKLERAAARPFSSQSELQTYERKILDLGDSITSVARTLNEISFSQLDTEKFSEETKKEFENLQNQIQETQNKINGIKFAEYTKALGGSLKGLRENIQANALLGDNLIDENSIERTIDNLEKKFKELSTRINRTKTSVSEKTTQVQAAVAERDNIAAMRKAATDFASGGSKEDYTKTINSVAARKGMSPEDILQLYGLPVLTEADIEAVRKKTAEMLQQSQSSFSKAETDALNKVSSRKTELSVQAQNLANLETARDQIGDFQTALAGHIETVSQSEAMQAASRGLSELGDKYNDFKVRMREGSGAVTSGKQVLEELDQTLKGVTGSIAQASTQLDSLNRVINGLNSLKSRIGYFFSFYKVIGSVTREVKKAFNVIKELDSVITEIAIVTNMTQEELWGQVDTYSNIAKQYGTSIKGAYEVSQLFYQQGLQTNDVMKLTVETLKLAKISNLDYSTATDFMTVA